VLAATEGAEAATDAAPLGLVERLGTGAVALSAGGGTLAVGAPLLEAEGTAGLAESCALTAPEVTVASAGALALAVGRLAPEVAAAARLDAAGADEPAAAVGSFEAGEHAHIKNAAVTTTRGTAGTPARADSMSVRVPCDRQVQLPQ
jgi:hypothetical protein